MNPRPLVSVIIPVYNVSSYLAQCLDSVLSQTYQNMEILLIDDGSTDKSGRICDIYAEQDYRVQVIHKENGGLSDARNAGLERIKGEYVTFVDSDDYIHVSSIAQMTNCALHEKLKLVMGSYIKFLDGTKPALEMSGKRNCQPQIFSQREIMIQMLYRKKIATYSHGKLYHSSLFETVRFPRGRYFEDIPTTWAVVKQVDRAAYIEEPLYYYRQRPDSIVQKKFSEGKMDQVYMSGDIVKEIDKDMDLHKAAVSHYFFDLADIYAQVDRQHKAERKFLVSEMKKYRRLVISDRENEIKLRGMAALAFISMPAVKGAGRLYKKLQQRKWRGK